MSKPPRHRSVRRWGVADVEGGKRVCRWCRISIEHLPVGRTFCGNKVCVHEWRIRSDSSYARREVEKRDRGVCVSCGADTIWMKGVWRELHRTLLDGLGLACRYSREGFDFQRKSRAWKAIKQLARWEMDHILPVAEGGGDCGLENLRTLCGQCHSRATAALRRRLNERKKQAITGRLFGGVQ